MPYLWCTMLKQISEFWVVVMFLCSASRIFEPLRTWIRTFDICVLGVVKILSGGYVFDIVRVTAVLRLERKMN